METQKTEVPSEVLDTIAKLSADAIDTALEKIVLSNLEAGVNKQLLATAVLKGLSANVGSWVATLESEGINRDMIFRFIDRVISEYYDSSKSLVQAVETPEDLLTGFTGKVGQA